MKKYLNIVCLIIFIFVFSCTNSSTNYDNINNANINIPESPIVVGNTPTFNHKPTWFWNVPVGTVKFRFQLYDGTFAWQETNDNSVTSYTPLVDLPSGFYSLYVQAANSSNIWSSTSIFTIEILSTDTLLFFSIFKDGINGVNGLDGAIDVIISPDGGNLYAVGNEESAIALFNRNVLTGSLTYSTYYKQGVGGVAGLSWPTGIAISPDGLNIYICSSADNALTVFNRNIYTGELTYSGSIYDNWIGIDGLDGAYNVVVSLDGKNIYVTGNDDNALTVFNRNTATGALTYSTCLKDGVSGIDGLYWPRGLCISPDDKTVYVAGRIDNSISVFNRNISTGELTYSTCFKDGVSGVDGLDGAYDVVVSPDCKNVYACSIIDNAITVFNRNQQTGELTYSTCFKDGLSGVDGLLMAYSITVSSNGKYVYVAGIDDNAIAIFKRNIDIGALSFYLCYKDGINGIDGLYGASSICPSQDGKNIYVTGKNEDSLSVFSIW